MNSENLQAEGEQKNSVFKVTPLSKYLAMLLFIALPFIGGWVGYQLASMNVGEIESPTTINTEIGTESEDNDYFPDEGLLTLTINPETTFICHGFDQVDHTCIKFKDPQSVDDNKTGVLRINDIVGFEYDVAYSYVITVERLRSEKYQRYEDAEWYDYTLKAVVSKEMIL